MKHSIIVKENLTMKHPIKVNFTNNSIEVSASFLKKASVYDSWAYHTLINAQKQLPAFMLKVIPPKQKTTPIITFDFMRKYIIAHDDSGEILYEFEAVIAICRNILQVKQWFMKQYPTFKNCKSKEEWLLVA